MDLTKLNPGKLILTVLILIGLVLNTLVSLSLPLTDSPTFYIFAINYETPFNGTLNGNFAFFNISSIRLGNWGACFFDLDSSNLPGIICTKFSFLYSVAVIDQATGIQTDLVSKGLTSPLILHVLALITSFISVISCKTQFTWSYVAFAFNLAAVIYDFVFYYLITNSLRSTPGLTTSLGSDPSVGILSLILLALVIVHRTIYKGK